MATDAPASLRIAKCDHLCAYCGRRIRKGNRFRLWVDQTWHQSCYRITTDETYRPYDIKEGGR